MSLYADYIKEREGKLVVENENGFIKYSIDGELLYIEDIYIVPAKRRSNLATEMADFVVDIGKAKGCKKLYGSVAAHTPGGHQNMLNLIGYGMRLQSSNNSLIFFVKDI